MAARSRVPRLSYYYQLYAEYFFIRGAVVVEGEQVLPWPCSNDHSVWFYLMSAWFYEDDDEELGRQGDLFFDLKTDDSATA